MCSDEDDEHDRRHHLKCARMSRPQSLGARLAARRQQDAQQALEREEENIDADASMMLSEGLQQALSEMSKVFAEVKTGRSQRE